MFGNEMLSLGDPDSWEKIPRLSFREMLSELRSKIKISIPKKLKNSGLQSDLVELEGKTTGTNL
jgi:hypothetical protein